MDSTNVTTDPNLRPRRGGLQRRFAIIEPALQPDTVTDKIGKDGRVVSLKSNYANFNIKVEGPFYMYDVVMENKSIRTKLELLLAYANSKNNGQPFCFDGRRLFTTSKWHSDEDTENLVIKDVEISIRLLTTFLKNSEEYYQMINIVFNNIQIFMGQEKIGRQFFLGSNCESGGIREGPSFFKMDNFKILGGYSTTITRGTNENGTASTLLYLERINRVLNENNVVSVYRRDQIDQLIGRDIITKYNNKTYRISDIKEMDVNDEVQLGDKKISYLNYFKQRYNINLKNDKQPFVISRVKRSMVRPKEKTENEPEGPTETDQSLSIPGELCYLCGFSDSERSNINLQKNLGTVLKREPRERLNDIRDFCKWTGAGKSKDYMKSWGMCIEEQPITIRGRELAPVDIFSNEVKINTKIPDDWKFGEIKFDVPKGTAHRFGVLVVDRNPSHFNNFIEDVKREIGRLRINYTMDSISSCRSNEVEDALTDFIRVSKVHMALVFIPDDKVYAKVKNFTMSTGLLTQCVTQRNGSNRDDRRRKTVADKSVMQMFSKLGYDPWGINLKMAPTMIVGLDTFHSKTGKRSVQASVFSISAKFSQYISFVNSSKGKNEFHENLGKNFLTALTTFQNKFNTMPLRLIIYRDGVGDSQLAFTKKFETDAVMKMIEKIYENQTLPQIIYVVVKKRISVKFFKDGANPNPGTVVDEKIVKPNFYEFYLVSQKTTKGTASPTNYNVLMDTKFTNKKTNEVSVMSPSVLQQITYSLTHLYFNWMGTIRVPVPTHYAHRLAELVGKIHRGVTPPAINDRIRERLFYL
uniref:Piwi-like protein 1 n=1 Tax=Schmidtea mediterranea TaxID=79327 RepID=PIWI1_SCHMD|nr:RecName: Full=Piwi-like protein 1; AltName: Full=SMEDWI-1 [Schmidtea mediterranea]ABB77337.1 PIWI-like protein 1 [Schmidtea mediterranea]